MPRAHEQRRAASAQLRVLQVCAAVRDPLAHGVGVVLLQSRQDTAQAPAHHRHQTNIYLKIKIVEF